MRAIITIMTIKKKNQTRIEKNMGKTKEKPLKPKKNTRTNKTSSSSKRNDLFYNHYKIIAHTPEKC